MDDRLRRAAEAAIGFMPPQEGAALYRAALVGAEHGPVVEIGTYCGKSTIYLAAAARERGAFVVTVDHHRGSEEQQPGWEYHDPRLFDATVGRMDTLPAARRCLDEAGVADCVIMVVGRSADLAAIWATPAGLVFIDGGHSDEAANQDYEGWARHVARGGLLAIHDVFPDPADGGQAPWRIYQRAVAGGLFTPWQATGSLRVLARADL